jgi:hypothetical protein
MGTVFTCDTYPAQDAEILEAPRDGFHLGRFAAGRGSQMQNGRK